MSYASELLDGFNESVEQFGTTIHPVGSSTPVPVLVVDAERLIEMMGPGYQPKGSFNFEVTRTAAVAAGLAPDAKFTPAGGSRRYIILPVEDDPGLPIMFVSAEVDQ